MTNHIGGYNQVAKEVVDRVPPKYCPLGQDDASATVRGRIPWREGFANKLWFAPGQLLKVTFDHISASA